MEKENVVWELPVHRSLTKPVYWMGVPRGLFILELLFAVLGGIIFKSFIVIVIAVIAHLIFKFLGNSDPLFHEVFMRSLRHDMFYRS